MPLVTSKEMFEKAYNGGYAIGAFNVNNMEIIQGIMQAAADEKSPVILQVSAGARKYAGQIYIMKLVEAALTESPEVPVCVHLDHGPSFEMCKDCIDGGFTSVMIDGSALPYEENVALTKKVVDYAHPRGVWVEAELGKLAGIEEHVKSEGHQFTDPDQLPTVSFTFVKSIKESSPLRKRRIAHILARSSVQSTQFWRKNRPFYENIFQFYIFV